MVPAAGPLTAELPTFEVEEPFTGPRDNGFGDELIGRPNGFAGIEKTKRKPFAIIITIDVRRRLSDTSGV